MNLRRSLPVALLIAAGLSSAQIGSGVPAISLTPVVESPAANAGETVRIALSVTVPEGLHLQSDHPRDPALIPTRLSIETPDGITWVDVVFPRSTEFSVVGFDEPLDVFEGDAVIGARIAIAGNHPPGTVVLPGSLRYQACNDTACFPPRTVRFEWTLDVRSGAVAGTGRSGTGQRAELFGRLDWTRAQAPPAATSTPAPPVVAAPPPNDVLQRFERFEVLGTTGYASAPDFVEFIHNAEAGVRPRGMFEGRGPLAILLIVFIGGLALNLTPCVLPMIPINLAIIGAGARAQHKSRGFLLGLVYGAAMALVYGVLGLVVILTAGTFGTINASPWFNAGIAVLFVFLGLAMFDVFSLDFSRFSSRIRFDERSRGSVYLAFGMGAVAALLAGACVAPVVVQVIVFASNLYASGTTIALALPFVLGLGMALPWPLAGAGISALPKPGAWMVRVKHVMGAFILATAAYYAYTAYEIVASRWVDPESVRASVEEQLKSGWTASLSEGLAEAERTGSLVLVDFWATWCKNCLVMDRTTLQDPSVLSALDGYKKIKFQAEDLDTDPAKQLMQRTGGVGLPWYVILKPTTADSPLRR